MGHHRPQRRQTMHRVRCQPEQSSLPAGATLPAAALFLRLEFIVDCDILEQREYFRGVFTGKSLLAV